MKLFKCQNCGQLLYFENRQCQNCGYQVGYVPEAGTMTAIEQNLEKQGSGLWRSLAWPQSEYRFCSNAEFDVCNWLVPSVSPDLFCAACRHNQTIPDLGFGDNLGRWRKIELAKHRLFYTLIRLRLPLPNRIENPAQGLAFNFLNDVPDGLGERHGAGKVMTGHEDGLIAINMKEADDAERERLRLALGEPYRTLLGHLRHEVGHYFWDRLIQDQGHLEECREFFGDERADYQEALRTHYANGPNPNWRLSFISSYASAHPWEDFAETWAHYLHIVDTLEMASAFGVHIQPGIDQNANLSVALDFDPYETASIERMIEAWLPLTFAVNSINRCMGEPDLYPFVLSPSVITKLGFVHRLVHP